MMSDHAIRQWATRLKKYLNSDQAYALLPEDVCSWISGGCLPLARALVNLLGPEAELRAIGSDTNMHEHVVVVYGSWYFDGDGASHEVTLLRRWRTQEYLDNPFLLEFSDAYATQLYDNAELVAAITEALRAEVGPIGFEKMSPAFMHEILMLQG